MVKHPIWSAGHRLTLCWLSLASAAVCYFEPASLMRANFLSGGLPAQMLLALLVLSAVMGLIDVVCNDTHWAPGWEWLLNFRSEAYMLQGAGNLIFVFVLLKPGTWTWVASIYFVLACGSMWVSVLDTLHAVKRRRQNA